MLSTNSALATIDRKAKLIVTSQRQSNCSDRKDEVEIRKAKRETLALLGGARVSEFSLEPLGPATPIHCRKITVVRVIWISLSDLDRVDYSLLKTRGHRTTLLITLFPKLFQQNLR